MKNKQAGGIVSFIIVTVALAGLLAGGLYLSKQQGRTARDNDTSTPQVATNNGNEPNNATNQQGKGDSDAKEEQDKPADTPAPAPQQNTQGTGNQNQPAPSTSTPGSDRVANTGPSEQLPSTGPGETAAVSLALGSLVFTGYMALQSRRTVRRSALRQ